MFDGILCMYRYIRLKSFLGIDTNSYQKGTIDLVVVIQTDPIGIASIKVSV